MPMIIAPWGDEKTSKTTFALSFPKPLYHFDIDVGGYERAAWRIQTDGITTERYSQQMQVEELTNSMMGNQVTKTKDSITIKFPKKVVGMRELWQKIITDYIKVLSDPKYQTIVFDSFTQMWNICHKAHLQEKQEKQLSEGMKDTDSKFRSSLKSIEYGTPNDRMRAVIYNARSTGKNLVLNHYPRDVYGVRVNNKGESEDYRTGQETLDGFKEVAKLIDIAVRTQSRFVDKKKVVDITITTCGLPGLGFKAEGMKLPTPDYQGIMSLIEALNVS